MGRKPSFHSGGNTESLMNPAEVVMNRIQSDRMAKVFNLLAESVRQPGKPAHLHAHSQVGTLNVARRNMAPVWMARIDCSSGPQAHCWTVPHLFLGFPINLDKRSQHRIRKHPQRLPSKP